MISSTNSLRIMYWNANSVRNKIYEFYHYLTTNNIHVACLSETFLKSEDRLPSHPFYVIYRLDRLHSSRGGVAIVVNRLLDHQLLPDLNMRILETIGIRVNLANGNKMDLFSAYLPGSGNTDNQARVSQHFINDLRKVTRRNGRTSYFLCGDLNARHRHFNCLGTNRAGRLLYDEYVSSEFVVALPNSPTYIPEDDNRNPSTIDIMLTNSLLRYSDLTCEYLGSDHNAVRFDVQLTEPSLLNNAHLIRAYNQTDWNLYQDTVLLNIEPTELTVDTITSTEEIDSLIINLTEAMLKAQDLAVPLVPPHKYDLKLTPYLESLISLRRFCRGMWQDSRDPYWKSEVNSLTAQIRDGILTLRNEKWASNLQSLPQDDNRKSLWRIAKILKNRDRTIPVLKDEERLIITPEEKAEVLADKFAKFHDNPLASNDPQFEEEVVAKVQEFMTSHHEINPEYPTVAETAQIVRQLKNPKAPGLDRVHNRLIKQLPLPAIARLNLIICLCLKLCYFPSAWKLATVIPIRKPGKVASDPSSYRPISLLSSLSKILERDIFSRMNKHTEAKDILPDSQYGFRQFRSTTQQLHRVTSFLRQNLSQKRTSGMILFDIEKAFDRIWHPGLIYKMIQWDYPAYIIKIVASFLQDRSFRVSVGQAQSRLHDIPFGVPQGAVLSPGLYNIYTADAPSPPDCTVAFFADDTALISALPYWQETHEALTGAINDFFAYYDRWKINLNQQKTQALLVTRRRTREMPITRQFDLNGHEIEWEFEGKYLGMIFDKTMTMKKHVDHVIEKTQKAIKLLYPLINRRSTLSTDNKKLIFKTALRPIYTYACPLFTDIAEGIIPKSTSLGCLFVYDGCFTFMMNFIVITGVNVRECQKDF